MLNAGLGDGGGGSGVFGNVIGKSLLGVRTEHPSASADNANGGNDGEEGRPTKMQKRPSTSVLDLQVQGDY